MSDHVDVTDHAPSDGPRVSPLFEQGIAALVEEHERARAARLHTIAERMAERDGAEHAFAQLKPLLRERLIRPRLEALARRFPHARLEDGDTTVGVHTRLVLEHTDRFPVKATLMAGALLGVLDAQRPTVQLFAKAEFVPLLMAPEPSTSRDVRLDDLVEFSRALAADGATPESAAPVGAASSLAAWEAATQWLDAQLLTFLQVYLGTETDPRYQQMAVHVDPVCGMKVHAGIAASRQVVHGHAYVFCSDKCAERFAADPACYVNARRDAVGA